MHDRIQVARLVDVVEVVRVLLTRDHGLDEVVVYEIGEVGCRDVVLRLVAEKACLGADGGAHGVREADVLGHAVAVGIDVVAARVRGAAGRDDVVRADVRLDEVVQGGLRAAAVDDEPGRPDPGDVADDDLRPDRLVHGEPVIHPALQLRHDAFDEVHVGGDGVARLPAFQRRAVAGVRNGVADDGAGRAGNALIRRRRREDPRRQREVVQGHDRSEAARDHRVEHRLIAVDGVLVETVRVRISVG